MPPPPLRASYWVWFSSEWIISATLSYVIVFNTNKEYVIRFEWARGHVVSRSRFRHQFISLNIPSYVSVANLKWMIDFFFRRAGHLPPSSYMCQWWMLDKISAPSLQTSGRMFPVGSYRRHRLNIFMARLISINCHLLILKLFLFVFGFFILMAVYLFDLILFHFLFV